MVNTEQKVITASTESGRKFQAKLFATINHPFRYGNAVTAEGAEVYEAIGEDIPVLAPVYVKWLGTHSSSVFWGKSPREVVAGLWMDLGEARLRARPEYVNATPYPRLEKPSEEMILGGLLTVESVALLLPSVERDEALARLVDIKRWELQEVILASCQAFDDLCLKIAAQKAESEAARVWGRVEDSKTQEEWMRLGEERVAKKIPMQQVRPETQGTSYDHNKGDVVYINNVSFGRLQLSTVQGIPQEYRHHWIEALIQDEVGEFEIFDHKRHVDRVDRSMTDLFELEELVKNGLLSGIWPGGTAYTYDSRHFTRLSASYGTIAANNTSGWELRLTAVYPPDGSFRPEKQSETTKIVFSDISSVV